MKYLILIVLLITVISCTSKESIESDKIKTYTSKQYDEIKSTHEFAAIELDSLSNYHELLDKLSDNNCNDLSSVIKFKNKNINYFLTGFYPCPQKNHGIACYFRVNHIYIHNDSIYTKFYGKNKIKEPIEKLSEYLEEVIFKKYNCRTNENIMKRAIVNLSIDKEHPISMTKEVLSRISEEFKKVEEKYGENFFEHHILFERIDFLSIPPPPLPPKRFQ